MLTGLGQGSMFGAEPLDAEEVADATLQTLTSENAYVPVGGMADWSEVTCEDGLDFEKTISDILTRCKTRQLKSANYLLAHHHSPFFSARCAKNWALT